MFLNIVFAGLAVVALASARETEQPSGEGEVSEFCRILDQAAAGEWLIVELDGVLFSHDESSGRTGLKENCIVQKLHRAQRRGVGVIGLANPPREGTESLWVTLSRFGLDFSRSPLPSARLERIDWGPQSEISFANGVIFVLGQDHPELIRTLLTAVSFLPTRLTVIAAHHKSVTPINRMLRGLRAAGLPVRGLARTNVPACRALLTH